MFEQEDSCSNPYLQKISCPVERIVTLNSYVTCLLRKTSLMETLPLIRKHTIFLLECDDCSFPQLIAACVCFALQKRAKRTRARHKILSSIQESSELSGQDDLPVVPDKGRNSISSMRALASRFHSHELMCHT